MTEEYLSKQARFSHCRRYRYWLGREWNQGIGTVLFIGLNPSTADHVQDDPTIRRCVRFARSWGYRRMEIVNLFAFRATLPEDLKAATNPVGPANDRWIRKAEKSADIIIACWGNQGSFLDRDSEILEILGSLHCIQLNKSKIPAHPLYLKANLQPQPLPA